MIVIHTQDYENYAAHQGFTGEYYWKAKGGSEFKITGIPEGVSLDSVVDLARERIEQNNEYFQTQILGATEAPDTYLSWFEQSQLEYDGVIQFKEPTIEYGSLVDKTLA